MARLMLKFSILCSLMLPCGMFAQSSGPTAPPPPVCSSSNAGALYTQTSTSPPTVFTCSYYNLSYQWVVNPSYGGLVYYPTVPATCSGALPAFLAGYPATQMYVCVGGTPEPIAEGGAIAVGTTPVSGGTSGQALTINSGVLGSVGLPSVSVNGAAGSYNFNGATPAADSGYQLGTFKVSGSSVSVEVPNLLDSANIWTEGQAFANATNKLPRVHVNYPDFGVDAGCPNAADGNYVLDSTCAIKAAITYAETIYTLSGDTVMPALYIPEGHYKLSSELVVPCSMQILGDGHEASILQQTGTYADGIKVIKTDLISDNYTCSGKIRDLQIEGSGGSTWGTLLEIQSAVGYEIDSVTLYATAGRGFQNLGDSERMKINNLEITRARWSAIFSGANEVHWTGVQINSPGSSGSNGGFDCYETECGTSYEVPPPAPSGLTLATASVSGAVATFTISGATSAVWTVGQNVQIAGPWSLTGYQAVYPISTIGYSSGTITLTAPAYWGQSGSGSVSGATILTAWAPPQHAAITVESGTDLLFANGSIKSLERQNAFQEYIADGQTVQKLYMEGAPSAGSPPRISHSTVAGGTRDIMQISGTTSGGNMTTTTVPWNQGMWGISWYNDVADVTSSATYDTMRIYPPDAAYGSTTTSAYQSGVEQGQFENVGAVFSPDGSGGVIVTLVKRNLSGSTAPANTAWVANSLMLFYSTTGNYGDGFQAIGNHTTADAGDSETGYYANCSDTVPGLVCAEAIVGYEPNGITDAAPEGGATNGAVVEGTVFRDDAFVGSGSEVLGASYVKNPSSAVIVFSNATSGKFATGELNPILSGTPPTGPFDQAMYSVNYGMSGATWNWFNPNVGWQAFTLAANGDPGFTYMDNQTQASSADMYGAGSSGSADFIVPLNTFHTTGIDNTGRSLNGYEFSNKYCVYDAPATSGGNSSLRWCLNGQPGNTGSEVWSSWSGSAWVPQTTVTSSGFAASYATLSALNYAAGGGTANNQTVTLPISPAFSAGFEFSWLPAVPNSSSTPVVNVNGHGTKTVVKCGQQPLASGDISTLQIAAARYDGTYIELDNPVTGCTATLGTTRGGTGTSTAPTAGQVLVGQSGSVYAPETVSGDCGLASSGAMTCNKGKVLSNCGTLTTTAASSDSLSCTWVTSSSTCGVTATNSTAAGLTGVYAVPGSGSVVVYHSATASGTFGVACSAN